MGQDVQKRTPLRRVVKNLMLDLHNVKKAMHVLENWIFEISSLNF